MNLIDDIIARMPETELNADDYVGEDGLIYCGICNTRKQFRSRPSFLTGNESKILPCLCKCETERRDREEAYLKDMQKRDAIASARAEGFPDSEMSKFTFAKDDNKNKKITEALKRYCHNFEKFRTEGKGLLLYGKCETGKTFHACCVANELIDMGYKCMATSFARIANTLFGLEDKQGYYDMLNSYDLLVIDDLGAERDSAYMGEIVFNVIDGRDRAGLPTIITTNLSLLEIKNPKDLTSQRIYSRIIKDCFPIEIKGIERRREKANQDYSEFKQILGL